MKKKITAFKFSFLCVILSLTTVFIPTFCSLLTLFLPFLLRFLGFFSFPKYLIRNKILVFSFSSLTLFVVTNYYQVYSYGLGDITLPNSIVYATQIISMYYVGIFLDYKKMPFFPLNLIIINVSLFSGFISWVFLSVAFQNSFAVPGSARFVILNRVVNNFWSPDKDFINGTSVDMISTVGISLIGTIILMRPIVIGHIYSTIFLKSGSTFLRFSQIILGFLALCLLFFCALYSALALLGRSTIIALFACIFATFLVKNFFIKKSYKSSMKIIFYSSLFLILLVYGDSLVERLAFIMKNLSEVGIGSRFADQGLETSRQSLWLIAIREMWNSPWGGRVIKLEGSSYVHNIWLDQMNDAGIPSMVFLLLFHFAQLISFFKLFRLNLSKILITFFVCTNIAFFVTFVQQPVIQANVVYFAMTCFSLGSLTRLGVELNKQKKSFKQ